MLAPSKPFARNTSQAMATISRRLASVFTRTFQELLLRNRTVPFSLDDAISANYRNETVPFHLARDRFDARPFLPAADPPQPVGRRCCDAVGLRLHSAPRRGASAEGVV